MTICIAAISRDENDTPVILSCADMLASSALGKAETAAKMSPTAGDWVILKSGEEPDMTAVSELIRRNFRQSDPKPSDKMFDEDCALKLVRSALKERKLEKADEVVASRYGISYEELRKTGPTQFPPDLFREAMWEVRDTEVAADFIVLGFTGLGHPTIIQTRGGKAHITEPFATIGSGSYLAHSVLMHRGYHEYLPFDDAVYVVAEAKKYAEGEAHVGPATVMLCARQSGERFLMTDAGRSWAEENYRKYGPRSIEDQTFKLPEDAWEEAASTIKMRREAEARARDKKDG